MMTILLEVAMLEFSFGSCLEGDSLCIGQWSVSTVLCELEFDSDCTTAVEDKHNLLKVTSVCVIKS